MEVQVLSCAPRYNLNMEGIEQNGERNFETGEKVKVIRSSGEMEDGWEVVIIEGDRVMVTKDGHVKHPTLVKLREWNG